MANIEKSAAHSS